MVSTEINCKTCSKCSETKPATEFRRNRSKPDGLQSQCKPCQSATCTAWVRANPERHRGFVAKQTARDRRKSVRYVRAVNHFGDRQGWRTVIATILAKDPRRHCHTFCFTKLDALLSDYLEGSP